MSQYFPKEKMSWTQAPVRGGTIMEKSIVWEGDFGVRSAFFRMPKDMAIPVRFPTNGTHIFCA